MNTIDKNTAAYIAISEIAEDVQIKRGFPNVKSLINSGLLNSYAQYKSYSDELTLEEWTNALTDGFSMANEDAFNTLEA